MWVFDVDTLKFLDVNNVALKKYGYSLAEFLTMSIDNIRPPEDIASLRSFLQQPIEVGAPSSWRHRLKNGEIIHVSISAYPVTYQSRQAMVVSARDITELINLQQQNEELLQRERLVRKEAETAARYFQSLFETIPGKFLVVTPERFEIVAVSDAYLAATMRTREDIKGKVLFDAFPASPDDAGADGVSKLYASLERARVNGVADVMAVQLYPIPRPSELGGGFESRYWSCINTPIKGPNGEVAYIVHRVEDITDLVCDSKAGHQGRIEHVLSEHTDLLEMDVVLRLQELKAAQRRAEELSDQLLFSLENMSDAFFTLDRSWRFTFMNAQAEKVLARKRTDLLGKVIWEEFPAAINSQFEACYKQAMNRKTTERFVEFYAPLEKWFEVNAYPATESLAVYFRDITESRLRDEQFRQAQKMEVLGQLTGGIAHDFNNLLTVIIGNTELLAIQLTDQPALRDLAQMAVDAADKGAELTNRLLAFARRQTLSPRVLDINRLIDDMAPFLQRALTENIAIVPRRTSELWHIEADPTQLESALLNIAINARDAMPQGGELTISTGNVTVHQSKQLGAHVLPKGDYVVICVSDTGTGIAPEVIDRVFEPFFTTKEVGKGSGLGLSMVFGFAQQSRGFVDLYSRPGEGTTLSLYFPRHISSVPAIKTATRVPSAISGGNEHILLVEDNDLVKDYVFGQLRALGYRVTTASNAIAALDILSCHSDVDLLLTDIIMPGGMSGIELAEAVRLSRPDIRVLFTSGFTDGDLDKAGRTPEGLELLTKPYKREELAFKVRKVLDLSP